MRERKMEREREWEREREREGEGEGDMEGGRECSKEGGMIGTDKTSCFGPSSVPRFTDGLSVTLNHMW